MTCLTPQDLERLARSQFTAERADALRLHADQCDVCRERLRSCQANEAFLDDLRPCKAVLLHAEADLSAEVTFSRLPEDAGQKPEAAAVESLPGYQIVRPLSAGGQGIVYEAIQLATQRTVAVKVLREGPFASERARSRFDREVRLVAAMKHPHIVVVHDSGVAKGCCYLVMDYVRGQPLDTHVRLTGPTRRALVLLLKSVCEAVAYAHRRGVIHRDLKPSNVLVEGHSPCILDFGLAKIINPDLLAGSAGPVSVPGMLMGTLAYMSPEQTRGEQEAVDVRTDVYAIGVMLYELVVGRRPYDTHGDLAEALRHIRETDPPRPSRVRRDLGSELDAIILKALEKDPNRRYGSAGELADDLQAWLDGGVVKARSASSFYVLRKLASRHYFYTSTLFALVCSMIGFSSIALFQLRETRHALRDKAISEENARLANMGIDAFLVDARRSFGYQRLGWFLTEWHHGRLDRARKICSEIEPDAPERLAMSFLLDETMTEDQFRARTPAGASVVYHFAVGERHLKAGRLDQADREFTQAIRPHSGTPGAAGNRADSALVAAAFARLESLRGRRAAAARAPAGAEVPQ